MNEYSKSKVSTKNSTKNDDDLEKTKNIFLNLLHFHDKKNGRVSNNEVDDKQTDLFLGLPYSVTQEKVNLELNISYQDPRFLTLSKFLRELDHNLINTYENKFIRNISPEEIYTDEKLLGTGGFSTVYKGTYLNHPVALKLFNIEARALESFDREAEIMSGLYSPYVVRAYGTSIEGIIHRCLVLEYMLGGSLFEALRKDKSIDWRVRYQIALDITHGVYYLHSVGVIHSDLKSPNVLLNEDMQAKLTDFGCSRAKLIKPNTPIGSFRWTAPEVLARKEEPSPKSDAYSYGMILWELGAKKVPFEHEGNDILLERIEKTGKIGRKETITDDTPSSLAKLIEKCWKARNKRPEINQTIIDFLEKGKEEVGSPRKT